MDALWSRGGRLLRVPIALQPRCSQTTHCPKDHGRGRGSAWASSTDAEDLESSLSQGPGCLLLGTEMQTLIQGPCLPPSLLLIKCCRTPVRCSPTPPAPRSSYRTSTWTHGHTAPAFLVHHREAEVSLAGSSMRASEWEQGGTHR